MRAIAVSGLICLVACSDRVPETTYEDVAPHQDRFVSVNGVRLHVLDWGGTGDNLLLIGGSDGSPHHFDDLASQLADEFRIVAPARRGHGQSSTPHEPFDEDVLAEDIAQLLDSLGITRTSVLAHSFGGAETTRFAALHPERVDRVIYLDAHYERVDSPWQEAAANRPAFPCFTGDIRSLGELRQCVLEHLRPGLTWSPTMEATLMDVVQQDVDGGYGLRAQTGPSRQLINDNYRREYHRLSMPVLVVFAERFYPVTGTDEAYDRQTTAWHERYHQGVREWAEIRLRESVPDVRLVTLPNTAHEELVYNDPVHRDPDRLADEIRAFLRAGRER